MAAVPKVAEVKSNPSVSSSPMNKEKKATKSMKKAKPIPKETFAEINQKNETDTAKAAQTDTKLTDPVKTVIQEDDAKTMKPTKSKAEVKAERRAQQEAQRAKKAASKTNTPATTENKAPTVNKDTLRARDSVTLDVVGTQQKRDKELTKQKVPIRPPSARQVRLFSHLYQYEKNVHLTKDILFSRSSIHPAIVKLGIQYANGVYCGSNSRCLALLAVFIKVISGYTTPPHKELSRDLDAKIKPYISFLTQCRPLSVSMGNAIKAIKWNINNMPSEYSDTEAKNKLIRDIETFGKEKIGLAGEAIADYVGDKITDGDVIVVYACSSVVLKVLLKAKDTKTFRVIVVDSRPKMEGREILRRLVKAGIECSYVLITTASYVMKEATKVLLGAHALLANGYVMSRVGSSMLALAAKSCNVPVLVCCESYKFCERVQTDSFVFNELGDPDDLVTIGNHTPYLKDWRKQEHLTRLSLLNLVYDVTPAEFISMVITELGMIPCTSVPVVLRVGQAKIL